MALAFLVRWLWRQGYLTHPWKGLGVPGPRVLATSKQAAACHGQGGAKGTDEGENGRRAMELLPNRWVLEDTDARGSGVQDAGGWLETGSEVVKVQQQRRICKAREGRGWSRSGEVEA